MIIQIHPFNDSKGLDSIKPHTTKLILGSFPATQVTNKDNPRLYFYYGSTDNKFWDIFNEVNNLTIYLSIENILEYLDKNDFGIIDIIRKCYRKDNTSSADEDLAILELQDIIKILFDSKIDTIYTTSKFVSALLKKQLTPIIDKGTRKYTKINVGNYSYEEIQISANIFRYNRQLKLVTLFSPSDNGLRGLQKGLNIKKNNIAPMDFRLEQYRQLLTNQNAT